MKLTGLNMVFVLDQFYEAESNYVIEEAGMGTFLLPNMTYTVLM